MNVFTGVHIVTRFDEQPIQVKHDKDTITIKFGYHNVDLTLTPAQFSEIAEACKAAAKHAEMEKAT
jgi:hypothetical protein